MCVQNMTLATRVQLKEGEGKKDNYYLLNISCLLYLWYNLCIIYKKYIGTC